MKLTAAVFLLGAFLPGASGVSAADPGAPVAPTAPKDEDDPCVAGLLGIPAAARFTALQARFTALPARFTPCAT